MPYAPGQQFCGQCGTALAAPPSAEATSGPYPARPAAGELRVVSVLFVDLVGFTSLAESRDAEDVRALLSRYFETARTIVERHDGTVAKSSATR